MSNTFQKYNSQLSDISGTLLSNPAVQAEKSSFYGEQTSTDEMMKMLGEAKITMGVPKALAYLKNTDAFGDVITGGENVVNAGLSAVGGGISSVASGIDGLTGGVVSGTIAAAGGAVKSALGLQTSAVSANETIAMGSAADGFVAGSSDAAEAALGSTSAVLDAAAPEAGPAGIFLLLGGAILAGIMGHKAKVAQRAGSADSGSGPLGYSNQIGVG